MVRFYYGVVIASAFALCVGCASVPAPTPAPAPGPALPTSASVGDTSIVAIAVPSAEKCCKKQTLPEFLGLDKLGAGIGGLFQGAFSRITSVLGLEGKFPGLQPKPPIANITDPANLSETASPSVQAAAKVKAEQDQASQKIQALRYLATIGCGGCYPEVEEALLAALDDCTEVVRYEAVKAMRGKKRKCCTYCSQDGCCSAKVQKKLNEIANKMKPTGGYVEPSERVRRLARLALSTCAPAVESDDLVPTEGPSLEPIPNPDMQPAIEEISLLSRPREVGLVNYESELKNDSDLCLADVNGEKIYARDLPNGKVNKQTLKSAIHQRLLRLEFLRQNTDIANWTPSVQSLFDKWLNQQISPANIWEPELQSYYQRNQTEFVTPPGVRWELATVDVTDARDENYVRNQLQALRDGLNTGSRPVKVPVIRGVITEAYSWTQPNEVQDTELRRALYETPVGKTSFVFKVENRLSMVRILEKRRGRLLTFNEAKDLVAQKLLAQKKRIALNHLIKNSLSRALVWTVFDQGSNFELDLLIRSESHDDTNHRKDSAPSNNTSLTSRESDQSSSIEKVVSGLNRAANQPSIGISSKHATAIPSHVQNQSNIYSTNASHNEQTDFKRIQANPDKISPASLSPTHPSTFQFDSVRTAQQPLIEQVEPVFEWIRADFN